jgi:hypothetical protein
MFLQNEMNKLLSRFDQEGIPVIPLKGICSLNFSA